jgi:hypothetical protein
MITTHAVTAQAIKAIACMMTSVTAWGLKIMMTWDPPTSVIVVPAHWAMEVAEENRVLKNSFGGHAGASQLESDRSDRPSFHAGGSLATDG